jgi:hypothetical protein
MYLGPGLYLHLILHLLSPRINKSSSSRIRSFIYHAEPFPSRSFQPSSQGHVFPVCWCHQTSAHPFAQMDNESSSRRHPSLDSRASKEEPARVSTKLVTRLLSYTDILLLCRIDLLFGMVQRLLGTLSGDNKTRLETKLILLKLCGMPFKNMTMKCVKASEKTALTHYSFL